MKLTVTFANATVFDFQSLSVAVGESFKINTDTVEPIQWFSNNDAVCDIAVSPDTTSEATFKTLLEGETTILFVNQNKQIIHSLTIEVKSNIKLNPIPSTPELKG